MMGHTTAHGWVQIALYGLLLILIAKPLGGYMTRVFNGERTLLSLVLRPLETRDLPHLRRARGRGAALAHLRGRDAGFQLRRVSRPVRAAAAAGRAAVQSAGLQCGIARSFVQHRGQLRHQHQLAVLRAGTTMSYLTQMVGLTVHNFVSAATGIALAVALIRGFARRSAQGDRQFLGRSHPLHALHPAADLDRRRRCSSSGRACRRISRPIPTPPRSKAPSRSSRKVRSPRRK